MACDMEISVLNHLFKIIVDLSYQQIATVDSILDLLDDMIKAETESKNWKDVFSYSVARTGMLEMRQFILGNQARMVKDRFEFVRENQNLITKGSG